MFQAKDDVNGKAVEKKDQTDSSEDEDEQSMQVEEYKPKALDPFDVVIKRQSFGTKEEMDLYRIYRGEAQELWQGYVQKTADFANVLLALTRLRQAAVHPMLLPDEHRDAIMKRKFEYGFTKTTTDVQGKVVKIFDWHSTSVVDNNQSDKIRQDDTHDIDDQQNEGMILTPTNTTSTTTDFQATPRAYDVPRLTILAAHCVVANRIPIQQSQSNNKKSKHRIPQLPTDVIDIIDKAKANMPALYPTKVRMILNYLRSIPVDDKVLIFSEWTSLFPTVSSILSLEGFESVSIDGQLSVEDRGRNIDKFGSSPNIKVMFVSLKIGSEGLNLVMANHVIFFEPWWNPFVHEQAQARVHRTGQTKKVTVVYFIIQNSIEEHVLNINEKKKRLAVQIMMGANKRQRVGLDKNTVRDLLMNDNMELELEKNDAITPAPPSRKMDAPTSYELDEQDEDD